MTTPTVLKRVVLGGSAILALLGAGCAPTVTQTQPTTTQQPAASTSAPAQQAQTATPPTQQKTNTTSPTKKPAAPTPTTATTSHTSAVTIAGKAFSPQVLAVTTGDTVVWMNKDTISHTTVSDNALIWDSGNLAPGTSYKRIFSAPGSYNYRCAIHPNEVGTIIVRDLPK